MYVQIGRSHGQRKQAHHLPLESNAIKLNYQLLAQCGKKYPAQMQSVQFRSSGKARNRRMRRSRDRSTNSTRSLRSVWGPRRLRLRRHGPVQGLFPKRTDGAEEGVGTTLCCAERFCKRASGPTSGRPMDFCWGCLGSRGGVVLSVFWRWKPLEELVYTSDGFGSGILRTLLAVGNVGKANGLADSELYLCGSAVAGF